MAKASKGTTAPEIIAAFNDNPHFERLWVDKDGKTWWQVKRPKTKEVLREDALAPQAETE